MVSILEVLGISEDELEWHKLAQCNGMDRELFYEIYESDPVQAKMVDEICLSCPVLAECLMSGIDNNEQGVWGGVYVSGGKIDKGRNAHKTEDVWKEWRKRASEVL